MSIKLILSCGWCSRGLELCNLSPTDVIGKIFTFALLFPNIKNNRKLFHLPQLKTIVISFCMFHVSTQRFSRNTEWENSKTDCLATFISFIKYLCWIFTKNKNIFFFVCVFNSLEPITHFIPRRLNVWFIDSLWDFSSYQNEFCKTIWNNGLSNFHQTLLCYRFFFQQMFIKFS